MRTTLFGRVAGLALLALLPGCYDSDKHSPTETDFQSALELTAAATSIPADGFSNVNLIAKLSPDAATDRRMINFSTDAGSFVGAPSTDTKKISVPIDTTGQARVQLQSERVVRTAEVTATVSNAPGLVKRVQVNFLPVNAGDAIQVRTSSATAPADGATLTRVSATIPASLPGDRLVTFKTNLGLFASTTARTDTATADASNVASLDLKSELSTGEARITASINGSSAETNLIFTNALPEDILVTTDKPAILANRADEAVVTVRLLRQVGTPSLRQVVRLRLVKAGTTEDMDFLLRSIEPSNAEGIVTAKVVAGNLAYTGPATILASVDGVTKVGQVNIEILAPPPATP